MNNGGGRERVCVFEEGGWATTVSNMIEGERVGVEGLVSGSDIRSGFFPHLLQ